NLPAWLPLVGVGAQPPGALVPQRVVLAPSQQAHVPMAVANSVLGGQALFYDGQRLAPIAATTGYTLFNLFVLAPAQAGDFQGLLEFRVAGPVTGSPPLTFNYAVRAPVDSQMGAGLVWINPRLVSPANYSTLVLAPKLCFAE